MASSQFWKMLGGGKFQLFKEIKPGFTLSAIQGADVDQNGLMDLAVTSLYADTVRILLQESPGEFHALDPIKVGFAPVGVALQDINDDEAFDLIVVNRDSNSLSLFVGNGKGSFTTVGHFGVGATPAALVVKDFDQDHLPDLATASTNVDGVSVLLSGGGGIPLPSISTDTLVFEQKANVSHETVSPSQQIRFSNIGLGLLRIDQVEISGPGAKEFALIDNTCQNTRLHTGEFCLMKVKFSSQQAEIHHATLTIQDNASGSPRRIILKGIIKG